MMLILIITTLLAAAAAAGLGVLKDGFEQVHWRTFDRISNISSWRLLTDRQVEFTDQVEVLRPP